MEGFSVSRSDVYNLVILWIERRKGNRSSREVVQACSFAWTRDDEIHLDTYWRNILFYFFINNIWLNRNAKSYRRLDSGRKKYGFFFLFLAEISITVEGLNEWGWAFRQDWISGCVNFFFSIFDAKVFFSLVVFKTFIKAGAEFFV